MRILKWLLLLFLVGLLLVAQPVEAKRVKRVKALTVDTYVVAAYDAPQDWKDRAWAVCDYDNDQVDIMAASELGKVELSPGHFSVEMLDPVNTVITQKQDTKFIAPAGARQPIINLTHNIEFNYVFADGMGQNQSGGYPVVINLLADSFRGHHWWVTNGYTDNIAITANDVFLEYIDSSGAGYGSEAGAGIQLSADNIAPRQNIRIEHFYTRDNTQASVLMSAHVSEGIAYPFKYITLKDGLSVHDRPWGISAQYYPNPPPTKWGNILIEDVTVIDSERPVIHTLIEDSIHRNVTVVNTPWHAFVFDPECGDNNALIDCKVVNAEGEAVLNHSPYPLVIENLIVY